MERVFAKREPSLFVHPDAAHYVQKVATWCAGRADEDFTDEEVAGDLAREGQGVGVFATLLVIGPCSVAPRRIDRWRSACRRAVQDLKSEAELDEFEKAHEECLELAFRLMLKKSSKP